MSVITKMTSTKNFDKELSRVPDFIRKKVMFWIFLVESTGINQVMKSPGFHDEPLKGKRVGQRSVRLNRSYRLIYHIIKDRIHLELLEVNKHEY